MKFFRKVVWAEVLLSLLFFVSISPLQAQDRYDYGAMPLGGSHILGSYSPAGTSMGETILGVQGPQAGFLNPGVLGLIQTSEFSIVCRLTHNIFRALVFDNDFSAYVPKKFLRDTFHPEWGGAVVSLSGWRFAASYSLAEEYNLPETDFSYNRLQRQSGKLHGINLAIARYISSSVSAGISFAYRFGKINHIFDYIDYSGEYIEHNYKLKGFAVNFGLAWKLNEKLTLGLAFRPPVKMKVVFNYLRQLEGDPTDYEEGHDKGYYKLPLAVAFSVAVRLDERFVIACDLSYWAWKTVNRAFDWYFLEMLPYYPIEPIRLSLGAEYNVKLRPGFAKGLRLRSGYIFDRQAQYNVALNYFTGGFGLDFGKFEIEAAAKIPLSTVEKWDRIHTSFFQLGAKYKF